MTSTIQKLTSQARFPKEEFIALSRKSISTVSHKASIPRPIAVPIMTFGHLFLKRVNSDPLGADKFLFNECDFRGDIRDVKDRMGFPGKELKALSKVTSCPPDITDPILHFGFNSLRRVDEKEAGLFLRELHGSVAARLKHLETNLFTTVPSHSQNFEQSMYNHFNHLCNLQHLLMKEDIERHHHHLKKLLDVINVRTPDVKNLKGLRELFGRFIRGDFNGMIKDPALSVAPDEPFRFWSLD